MGLNPKFNSDQPLSDAEAADFYKKFGEAGKRIRDKNRAHEVDKPIHIGDIDNTGN